MASPSGNSAADRGGLRRAVLHPVPLALLVIGGVTGAFTYGFVALIGLVAFAASAAVLAGRGAGSGGSRVRVDVASLRQPPTHSVAVRSTEVMAHVVRIRKGHQTMYKSLCDVDAGVRATLAPSYDRLCEVVTHAYGVARKADELRAHLDSSPPAAAIERELADATARAAQADPTTRPSLEAVATSVRERLETRRRLEREYHEVTAQLGHVAAMLEGFQARVLHMRAESQTETEEGAREMLAELEQMHHIVTGLEESLRV